MQGELLVRLESLGGRVTSASATAVRPKAARLLMGLPPRQAAPLLRSTFTENGRSQAIAARAAVEAIAGHESTRTRIRDRRICAETLQQHAWRLMVDAPRLVGRELDIDVVPEERRALAELIDSDHDIDAGPLAKVVHDWSARRLLGWEPRRFLDIATVADFDRWLREAGTPAAAICRGLVEEPELGASDVSLLPAAAAGWIAVALAAGIANDGEFEEHPHLDGAVQETGPLARRARHPLVAAAVQAWGRGVGARIVARLVEIAALLAALQDKVPRLHGAVRTGEGRAIAWVDTSPGLLVHAVALADERIIDYRIVAPVQWNFHPEGAFTRGALAVPGGSPRDLDDRVRRLVASLDPCVGVRYEANHA